MLLMFCLVISSHQHCLYFYCLSHLFNTVYGQFYIYIFLQLLNKYNIFYCLLLPRMHWNIFMLKRSWKLHLGMNHQLDLYKNYINQLDQR